MALFIPEWRGQRSMPLMRMRSILSKPDNTTIRCSYIQPCAFDVLFETNDQQWLIMLVVTESHSQLFQKQDILLEPDTADKPDSLITRLTTLGDYLQKVRLDRVMLILWEGDTDARRQLESWWQSHFNDIQCKIYTYQQIKGENYFIKLLARLVTPFDESQMAQVKSDYFPEIGIPPSLTTRSYNNRSYREQLRDSRLNVQAQLTSHFLDIEQEQACKLDLPVELLTLANPESDESDPAEPVLEETAETSTSRWQARLINGVAGSGKTLILLHRALLLTQRYPNEPILILIHNAPVVADLNRKVVQAFGHMSNRICIQTFYSWIAAQWKVVFGKPYTVLDFEDNRQLVEWLKQQKQEKQLDAAYLTEDYILEELRYLYDQQCEEKETYFSLERAGRKQRLTQPEREKIWQVFIAYSRWQADRNKWDWHAIPFRLNRELKKQPEAQRKTYRFMLVDEAQFFAPSWFQVVGHYLRPESQLFLCADPTQGFLRQRTSWRSLGINVVGRTRRLSRSYRTTQGILAAAQAILQYYLPERDSEQEITPEFERLPVGMPPALQAFTSRQDAQTYLVSELTPLLDQWQHILVIYGKQVKAAYLVDTLAQIAGYDRLWHMNDKNQRKQAPASNYPLLRVAQLDSVTGMEAPIVFLIGMDDLLQPDIMHADDLESAVRRLYMAMTRAGQRLVMISGSGDYPVIRQLLEARADSNPISTF